VRCHGHVTNCTQSGGSYDRRRCSQ
jgi:hypothetical protein